MTSQTSCSGWRDPSSVFAGPTIISLSSYFSPAGSTSLVVVFGANFFSYSSVRFGTFSPTVYFINSGQLQFYVPSTLFAGTYPVQVFNGSVGSNVVNYTIDNASGYWLQNPDGSISNTNPNGLTMKGSIGQVLGLGTGTNNCQYGDVNSLADITTGSSNTAVGIGSGINITSGQYNTLIGSNAGKLLTSGVQNTAIGYAMSNSGPTVNNNVAVGMGALQYCSSGQNVGVGVQANLYANSENTAIGFGSIQNTTGYRLTAIGNKSGLYDNGGINNTYLGLQTGQPNGDMAAYNYLTCVGSNSGQDAGVCASNRIILGSSSGGEDILLAGSPSVNFRTPSANVNLFNTTTGNINLGSTTANVSLNQLTFTGDSSTITTAPNVSYGYNSTTAWTNFALLNGVNTFNINSSSSCPPGLYLISLDWFMQNNTVASQSITGFQIGITTSISTLTFHPYVVPLTVPSGGPLSNSWSTVYRTTASGNITASVTITYPVSSSPFVVTISNVSFLKLTN